MTNKIINQNYYSQFQDYQLRNWDEEYLSEPEEEQWQNGIFRNMEIQEIRERTSAVKDSTMTTSEQSVPAEEIDRADRNGSQETRDW